MARIKIKKPSTVPKKNIPTNLLKKDKVGRTFIGTASQFVPGYETYLDVKDIVVGAAKGDKKRMNQGVVGLGQPFAGKAMSGALDYATEKTLGKSAADKNQEKRESILDMTTNERIALYKKYGRGGYDKAKSEQNTKPIAKK